MYDAIQECRIENKLMASKKEKKEYQREKQSRTKETEEAKEEAAQKEHAHLETGAIFLMTHPIKVVAAG